MRLTAATATVLRRWRNRALILLAFLFGAVGYALWVPPPSVPRDALDGRTNAIWLGHRWFNGEGDVASLAAHLNAHHIRDLYIHVGPLDARGAIPLRLPPKWPQRLAELRAQIPGARIFAWVGGVTVWSYGIADDTVDDTSPTVRAGIVATDVALVREAKFDGIHYDLEMLLDGDAGFLSLLDETRAAIAPAPLSVATPHLRPFWLPLPILWSPGYYREVGSRCDQIALMAYDSGMPTESSFTRFVAWETGRLSSLLPSTSLLYGVPTYPDATLSHRPSAETLRAALDGVALGGGRGGVAVYAEWTTTAADWERLPR